MITLNSRDARPIYEQVRDGLRQQLVNGAILPGEKLPSVRALASKLTINPNTIQRAYDALEKEGYVYSQVGKGTFAAPISDVNEERKKKLFTSFERAASELLFLGITAEELKNHLDKMEEKNHD